MSLIINPTELPEPKETPPVDFRELAQRWSAAMASRDTFLMALEKRAKFGQPISIVEVIEVTRTDIGVMVSFLDAAIKLLESREPVIKP